jgi:large subunit ribosomal protein L23
MSTAAVKAAAVKKAALKKSPAPVRAAYSKERLMNVLLAPHVTEKTSLAMQNANQYTFQVRRDADKPAIKAAVELMFDVKVAAVKVLNESGKERRFGKTPGRTQDWKKAYVKLEQGQSIDYEASRKA